ncbi:ASCH domain-containing protein [Clostridium estertheticum]|uniref:ASCH domain-containing protein n=1 Tax=Clostridium estertheticum TaxID=238834 RepID=A0AA47EIV6_9CLOT|nr:ASCH domain-containing protein [Clostridium estertheticum]MBU3156927.1 ASCH domain-containing protein [Clostridium estertheticum]WAG61017.1 ASCH domain-containing protein [Clostridium estertheticum]
MEHDMTLFKEPFNMIKNRQKIIEVRLNDEKRQTICVGDLIIFYKLPDREEKLTVKVLDKYVFENFEQLYSNFDFSLFGCQGYPMKRMIDETYDIYTKEQEKKYGVLGIKICLI